MNNKGFLLVETIVVSTFVLTTLILVYSQFSNLVNIYSTSYKYNTVEGIYNLNNVKKYLAYDDTDSINSKLGSNNYIVLYDGTCNTSNLSAYTDVDTTLAECNELFEALELDLLIYTSSDLTSFQSYLKSTDDSNISQSLKEFVLALDSESDYGYRLIAQYNDGTFASIALGDKTRICTFVSGLNTQVVTSGDGLYEDETETCRYVYKGEEPDNYIQLGDELFRIIAIESDGTIKIIKNESIGDMVWDTGNSNVWSTASLNTYLNSSYSTTALDYAVSHSWNVGAVSYYDEDGNVTYNLSTTISEEKATTWTGYVALATVSEYIRADSDETNCGSIGDNWDNNANGKVCYDTNWMAPLFAENTTYNWGWLLSPEAERDSNSWIVGDNGWLGYDNVGYSLYGVLPVMYLSSSITLSGSGTSEDPYVIS